MKVVLSPDIIDKVKADYGQHTAEVLTLLNDAISKTDYLNDRIVRCIIFLAERDLEQLKKYLKAALIDPRDVMYWAEYDNHDQVHRTIRVRDFSQPFEV